MDPSRKTGFNTRILILSSAEDDELRAINDAFVAKLNKILGNNTKLEWHHYSEVGLEIKGDKLDAYLVNTGEGLNVYSAVYFKSYFRYPEQAAAIAEVLAEKGIKFVSSELEHYLPLTKLTQLARLSRARLPIPDTIYLPLKYFLKNYDKLCQTLGVPFIFKAIDGSTGRDNYLVDSKSQLAEIVAQNPDKNFIAQAFIQNDSDLRLLVVGGKIRLVIERRRHGDTTHLNNTSKGAKASLLPLSQVGNGTQALALRAAKLMRREVAGVDIILENGSGTPYILEVNASPQIGSGAYQAEKLQIYAEYFANLGDSL